MKRSYFKLLYNQRNKDETIMSVIKRLFGEHITSRLVRTQNRELSFRCIAYNMHRMTNLFLLLMISTEPDLAYETAIVTGSKRYWKRKLPSFFSLFYFQFSFKTPGLIYANWGFLLYHRYDLTKLLIQIFTHCFYIIFVSLFHLLYSPIFSFFISSNAEGTNGWTFRAVFIINSIDQAARWTIKN